MSMFMLTACHAEHDYGITDGGIHQPLGHAHAYGADGLHAYGFTQNPLPNGSMLAAIGFDADTLLPRHSIGGGNDPEPPVMTPSVFTFGYTLNLMLTCGGGGSCMPATLTGRAILEINPADSLITLRDIDLRSDDADMRYHLSGMLSTPYTQTMPPRSAINFDGRLTDKTTMTAHALSGDATFVVGGMLTGAGNPDPGTIDLEFRTPDPAQTTITIGGADQPRAN